MNVRGSRKKRICCAIPLILIMGAFLLSSCSALVRREINEAREDFFQSMGFRWYFVDYEDEGKIALITNDCDHRAFTPLPFPQGELSTRSHDEQRQFESAMWQRIRDINRSRCIVNGNASIEEAKGWVRTYRRIDVNGSLSSFEAAKAEVVGKMLNMYAPGPSVDTNATLKHTVLVYLPQGPRWKQIDEAAYNGYFNYPLPPSSDRNTISSDMFDETHDLLCGCYPNLHPAFERTLRQLIEAATDGDSYRNFPGGHEVCVNSKSYSAHQVGRVIADNDLVFWYNVGPSFGLFDRRGVQDHAGQLPTNCATGRIIFGTLYTYLCDEEARNALPLNPLISEYHNVLRTSETPQCMITSYQDCSSLYKVGSALTNPVDFQFCPYSIQLNTPEHVGFSRDRRSCPPLLGIDILAQYLPSHDSSFICDDLKGCSSDCPYLCMEPENCCYAGHYEMNTSGESRCIQTGMDTRTVRGPCYRYGLSDTLGAIYDNLDTVSGGPRTIRILEAEADPICNRTLYSCETFPHPVSNIFLQAEHMEYFEGGEAKMDAGIVKPKEPKMIPEIFDCTNDFPSTCLACDKCGNEVMSPSPTTTDENPTGSIEIWYSSVLYQFGGRQECNIQPCMLDGVRDPRKNVDDFDVIYLGKNYPPTELSYQEDYNRIRDWSKTDTQFRLTRSDQTVPLTLHWVIPNDNAHNDQLHLAKIDEKSLNQQLFHWFGFINDPTWPLNGSYTEENFSRMSTKNFYPESLMDVVTGEYKDLAGAWLRLQARGDYWVVHDEGGYLDGSGSLSSPDRIVLIMRWDHNKDGYPDKPLPYPRRLDSGVGRLHAEQTNRRLTVYDVIPGNGTESGHDVEIEVQNGFPPTVLNGTPTHHIALTWGDQYRTFFNWDVHASWCRVFPDNIKCVGGTDPLPTNARFTMRVKVINDRNYFYRDYVMTVHRDP